MRKNAQPHPETDRDVLCPFCGTPSELASKAPWCTGCGAAGVRRMERAMCQDRELS